MAKIVRGMTIANAGLSESQHQIWCWDSD